MTREIDLRPPVKPGSVDDIWYQYCEEHGFISLDEHPYGDFPIFPAPTTDEALTFDLRPTAGGDPIPTIR